MMRSTTSRTTARSSLAICGSRPCATPPMGKRTPRCGLGRPVERTGAPAARPPRRFCVAGPLRLALSRGCRSRLHSRRTMADGARKVGSFEVIRSLGDPGGMAAVYLAYQPEFDRYVALKELNFG